MSCSRRRCVGDAEIQIAEEVVGSCGKRTLDGEATRCGSHDETTLDTGLSCCCDWTPLVSNQPIPNASEYITT